MTTPDDRSATTASRLPGLTVVVPAYNEEGALATVVRNVLRVGAGIADRLEVLVINDGSRDRTREIAESLVAEDLRVRLINHPFNLGFGASQKSGFGHATQEFITLVPADNQFDVECLGRYVPLIADADVVVGYRVNRGDRFIRRVNTKVFRWVMRALFGVRLRDINWVKLFRKRILDGIDIEFKGIGVDAEVIVKAARRGGRFAELPVSYLPRTTGRSTGDKPLNVIITVLELIILWYRVCLRRERP